MSLALNKPKVAYVTHFDTNNLSRSSEVIDNGTTESPHAILY